MAFYFACDIHSVLSNTITMIQMDICKHEYKYYHTQMKQIDVIIDIKAITVCQLLQICAKIYKVWCLVYNNKNHTKFYDLKKKIYDQYNFVWVDKKGKIQIQIYFYRKKANTNTHIFWLTKKANTNKKTNIWTGIPEDEYKYLSHTDSTVFSLFT